MPEPLPAGGLSPAETKDSHRGFCFNTRASEALDVDRLQKDVRSEGCRRRHDSYPCDLPQASVVIIFHNEHFVTLVRSIHAVLNNSPPELLKEIVVLDDASHYDSTRFYERHMQRLQHELEEYCQALPKVRLVRLKRQRGLMVARMEGAWRTSGEVLVVLDSHIEATPGWLEPLLARIAEDRRRVVVPSIDVLDTETMDYKVGGISLESFTWSLGQLPLFRPDTDEPANSSVMAGGLFAVDRAFFLHLGGYDPEMQLYSGEEMEMGFRTWQCGGAIEHMPCSHVGHIFRTPKHWQGQVYPVPGEVILRNRMRTAEVWLDDYVEVVRLTNDPLPPGVSVEPLEGRRRLREKLQCKSFSWYLSNVAKEVRLPRMSETSSKGSLANFGSGVCLDTLGRDQVGNEVGVYLCHGGGSQKVHLEEDGKLHVGHTLCVVAKGRFPVFSVCNSDDFASLSRWTWVRVASKLDATPGLGGLRGLAVASPGKPQCLVSMPGSRQEQPGASFTLSLGDCAPDARVAKKLWGWWGP